MNYREISPRDFSFAPFREIGENWGILTGQCPRGFNSMTVSWGGAGVLWSKPSVFVFVRPQRYTFGFLNEGDRFSLSLMPAGWQKKIAVFGSKSGREVDKYAVSGLTAEEYNGVHFCSGAETVFICRKVGAGDFEKSWILDERIDAEDYPRGDYHRMFIGEIETILKKTKKNKKTENNA